MSRRSLGRKVMIVVWPAFLMACVLELLVFAVVDPTTVHRSAPAVYTVGFFVFWAAITAAGAITQMLEREPPEVNRPRR